MAGLHQGRRIPQIILNFRKPEELSVQNNGFGKKTVGSLLAEQPTRAVVFDRYKIDFCCGGGKTLENACTARGVELELVIADLLAADSKTKEAQEPLEIWLNTSLTKLANHIEETHHIYLKQELPRLAALAEKVARVHGERAPQMVELSSVYQQMRAELEPHMMKEEVILFPFLRSMDAGNLKHACFGSVKNPINQMEFEHAEAGAALQKMRELTDDYTPPDDACNSWRALLDGLQGLDSDLRLHIHKESSILFPKAIEAEQRLL
jgi:regulator of cell morphogenesis and NO signaling